MNDTPVRASLRNLIDALEDRYTLLPTTATSFTNVKGISQKKIGLDTLALKFRELEVLVGTLDSISLSLRAEMAWVAASQNSHRPAAALPAELLAFVFELSCADTIPLENTLSLRRMPPRSTQTSIIQVCKRWREIGLSMSILWAPILIDREFVDCAKRYPDYARLRLRRCAPRLLVGSFNAPLSNSLSRVIDHSAVSRFQSLAIQCRYPLRDQLRELLPTQVPLPHLKSLSVVIAPPEWLGVDSETLDLRQSLHLRSLSLASRSLIGGNGLSILHPPRWAHLRHIILHGMICPTALSAIGACHETLEELVLDTLCQGVQEVDIFSPEFPAIPSLHRLQSLSICSDWYERIAPFIMAPNLCRLRISLYDSLINLQPLNTVYQHAFPNLRLLEISGKNNDDDDDGARKAQALTFLFQSYGFWIHTLAIDLPCMEWTALLLAAATSDMPNLEDLYIEAPMDMEQRDIVKSGVSILTGARPADQRRRVLHFGQSQLHYGLSDQSRDELRWTAQSYGWLVDFDSYTYVPMWKEWRAHAGTSIHFS